jgi:enamine deaminase RidA (YjgF/YER057c/UK114 family)
MAIDIVIPESGRSMYENFHFAPAVRHGDLILCSGQLGQGETPEDEFRSAWQAIGKTLEAAGASYADILEFTSYHVDMREHIQTFMKVKDEFITEPYPAWTAIGISELAFPGARVEIRVTARKP